MVSSDERRDNGKERKESKEIILASWGDRFLAWLIDFILVSIALAILFSAIAIPIWFFYYDDDMTESTTSGQSIGKRLLKIKTVDLSGNRIDIKSAAIESFGKAFLLPIDVILGWIFTNNKRQRVFSRISDTIVIKLKNLQLAPNDIKYTKD